VDVRIIAIPANLSEYGPDERRLKTGFSKRHGAAFLDPVGGLIEVRAHEEKTYLVGEARQPGCSAVCRYTRD